MNTKELTTLLKNVSILYVEDDDNIREELEKALLNYTKSVFVASSGYEGLLLYEEKKPQIVISDIMMPKLDGLSFIKEIRKNDLKTPVILMTAFTDKEYLLPAANLNIQSYLVKPVKIQELKQALFKSVQLLNQSGAIYVDLPNNKRYDKSNSELLDHEGDVIKLNKKEKKLIDLLIDNANRVVTYDEIEHKVWPDYFEVMTSMALRTIIKNLRKKISTDFIENISGQGYKVSL